MTKSKVVIRVGDKFLEFESHIHQVSSPKGLLIEHAFYSEFGKLPLGPHHEMEILDQGIWTHQHQGLIHWHQSRLNGRHFVCYPLPLPTVFEAQKMFAMWAVGTAFTMTHGIDFQRVQGEFYPTMMKKYGISVSNAFSTET